MIKAVRTKYLLYLFVAFLAGFVTISQFPRVKELAQYHLGVDGLSDLTRIRITITPKGKDLFFQGDGLRLAGTLFCDNNKLQPGIIFLHGSSVKGHRLGFYLVLCDRLSKNGFHVLSIDMRGFGGSENPSIIDSPESWNTQGDVSNAIDCLVANANVDTGAIYVVGHSAGANQAIIAGIHEPRIKKIVAIGPSRRSKERLLSDLSNERQVFIERFSRVRKLNKLVSWETYRQIATTAMIDSYIPYFQSDGHKPVFLIDGSRESSEDLEFLRSIYEKMKPPKQYVTIMGSNHYANTKGKGPLMLYHKQVLHNLVQAIIKWLHE